MSSITFKSALHSDKKAYSLSTEWHWNERGNAPLSLYLAEFETYGDNLTQHSGHWCVQWPSLTDACISLAQAIVADPLNEAWSSCPYLVHDTNPDLIRFAMSIRHREDKTQFYSLTERKLSSAESKRHDKRWEKVEPWMDGKPATVLSILLNAVGHADWLEKLCIAEDLRVAMDYPLWEDLFKPVTELDGDWHQAFVAFRNAARAVGLLSHATQCAINSMHNSMAEPIPNQSAA